MVMRQQQCIDPAQWHIELVEPDGGAAAGVDQQLLVAGFDQRARSEAMRARDRHTGPEQRDLEIVRRTHWCIFIPESLTTFSQ